MHSQSQLQLFQLKFTYSELLAKLGNLCNRVLKYSYSNFDKKSPPVESNDLLIDEDIKKFFSVTHDYVKKYITALEGVKIKEGLKIANEIVEEGNKFFQDSKPWDLKKTNPERCGLVISAVINFLRVIGVVYEPYIPSFSAKLYEILNIKYDTGAEVFLKTLNENNSDYISTLIPKNHPINEPLPLFKESMIDF